MAQKINNIAYFDEGLRQGPPIVLIHGFPLDHTMWQSQVQVLSKNYRVISYDVRGLGQSEAGDGQYSIELFVDDLIMLLDHLKLKQAVLCGLSMGGYIALRAAERYPERFGKLVLCDTKSGADNDEGRIKRAMTMNAVKKNGVERFANEFIKGVLTENTLKNKSETVELVLNMIRKNSAIGICGALLAMAARTDTTTALAKINVPVLILVGEEDKLTPPSVAEAMFKAFPKAAMHVIPKAAHMSNLENNAVFNEKLLAFLK